MSKKRARCSELVGVSDSYPLVILEFGKCPRSGQVVVNWPVCR